jgi:hypothetical protein
MHVRVCSEEAFLIMGCLYLFVALPIQIWFFTVLLACYRYLCDKRVSAKSLPTTHVTQNDQVRFDFCMQ